MTTAPPTKPKTNSSIHPGLMAPTQDPKVGGDGWKARWRGVPEALWRFPVELRLQQLQETAHPPPSGWESIHSFGCSSSKARQSELEQINNVSAGFLMDWSSSSSESSAESQAKLVPAAAFLHFTLLAASSLLHSSYHVLRCNAAAAVRSRTLWCAPPPPHSHGTQHPSLWVSLSLSPSLPLVVGCWGSLFHMSLLCLQLIGFRPGSRKGKVCVCVRLF